MSVRCGNHPRGAKISHDSAEAVRRCYTSSTAPAEPQPEPAPLLNHFGHRMHEDPCRCDPYDRCRGVREQDAYESGNWRDRFRAYND